MSLLSALRRIRWWHYTHRGYSFGPGRFGPRPRGRHAAPYIPGRRVPVEPPQCGDPRCRDCGPAALAPCCELIPRGIPHSHAHWGNCPDDGCNGCAPGGDRGEKPAAEGIISDVAAAIASVNGCPGCTWTFDTRGDRYGVIPCPAHALDDARAASDG